MTRKESTAFFIIPGFWEDASGPRYTWLRRAVQERGYEPVPVPITWKGRVMSDYIEDFLRCVQAHPSRRAYVLGFSYGSIVALCAANTVGPQRVFLCSLTPEFVEDIPVMKPWIQRLVGKRRLADSRTRSAVGIARELRVPVTVFYGTREAERYPQLRVRCEETVRLAQQAKLVVIPDAPHNIEHPLYREAVARELELL